MLVPILVTLVLGLGLWVAVLSNGGSVDEMLALMRSVFTRADGDIWKPSISSSISDKTPHNDTIPESAGVSSAVIAATHSDKELNALLLSHIYTNTPLTSEQHGEDDVRGRRGRGAAHTVQWHCSAAALQCSGTTAF